MTITEFLTARYDEEEADVKGHAYDYSEQDTGISKCRHPSHVSGWSSTCWRAQVSARVLADIAAKRAIVALHHEPTEWQPDRDPSCSSLDYPEDSADCETLRALAVPYADHPSFDPAWRTT